jgi:hypothetical protein
MLCEHLLICYVLMLNVTMCNTTFRKRMKATSVYKIQLFLCFDPRQNAIRHRGFQLQLTNVFKLRRSVDLWLLTKQLYPCRHTPSV